MWGRVVRIHWHDKQPIFSADFDPTDCSRVATAGGDNNVRVGIACCCNRPGRPCCMHV